MIVPEAQTVYIDTGSVKWRDSIIYKKIPSETTVNAGIYKARIETDSSSADLDITALGEVLNVSGFINQVCAGPAAGAGLAVLPGGGHLQRASAFADQ